MNPYIQYMYSYPHKTAYRPLSDLPFSEYAPLLSGGGHGLYLHIPFCQTKCGYCNLFSVAGQGTGAVNSYLEALERQSIQYEELLKGFGTEFSELVIGGGTPLFLTESQLEHLFCVLERYFHFPKNRELVIETAPNQTTKEKLRFLKGVGVTRVSMGIQSFSERELRTLRRQHTAEKAREVLELIKAFNFPCVNVDFIYGIPGQTRESLLESLREALEYEPDEIFLYPLYIREGVGLEGVVSNPQEAFRLYECASLFLQEKGFRQDSMRRFVKQGNERSFSECGMENSLALGCGGRSYLGALHFCTPYAVDGSECLRQLREYEETVDFTKIRHGILLSEEEQKRRYVIRHLFIYPGLNVARYQRQFGTDVREDFPLLADWMQEGNVEWRNAEDVKGSDSEYLALTKKGLGLSDFLGPQLISPEIQKAMDEWQSVGGGQRRKD